MSWCICRRSALVPLLIIWALAFSNSAYSYEVELRALAANLVSQLEAANQQSATVLDFTDLQGAPTELGRFLAQELSDQLFSASKKISFVDRANLQQLLHEKKLEVEGLINPETSRKLGNMIGIDTIIVGTTTPIGNIIKLSVRAIAVDTGRIVASQTADVPAIPGLGELYNRGVAPDSSPTESTARNIRDKIRPDSFKLGADQLYYNVLDSTLHFTVENHIGNGFGAAILQFGTSVGPCLGGQLSAVGIPVVFDNRNYVPPAISSPIAGIPLTQLSNIPDPAQKLL